MKHIIDITNEQKEPLFRGAKGALRRVVALVLEEENFQRKAEVGITFVTAEEIRRLNRENRRVDSETDVLSFPMTEGFDEIPVGDTDGDAVLLGDVIVCPSVIRRQAKEFASTYRDETCLMVIHSVLHLLGYDHMKPAQEKKMFAKQEKILERFRAEAEIQGEKNGKSNA